MTGGKGKTVREGGTRARGTGRNADKRAQDAGLLQTGGVCNAVTFVTVAADLRSSESVRRRTPRRTETNLHTEAPRERGLSYGYSVL